MPEITEADRTAAAEWCASQPFPSKQAEAPAIAAGEYDHHSLVQAFAAHREATEAAVVAWLRGIGFGDADQNRAKFEIMQAISAGAHRG